MVWWHRAGVQLLAGCLKWSFHRPADVILSQLFATDGTCRRPVRMNCRRSCSMASGGATNGGAAELRPVATLVRRPRRRRPGLGCRDFLEEPPAAARRRDSGTFPGSDLGSATGEASLSCDCLSVDGALIEAWRGMNRFRLKEGGGARRPPLDEPSGRNAEVHFHGQKRSKAKHASTEPLPI